jgi:uncharacterized RDD family membrane protein YckC
MFCPACGAASDNSARFCASCGRALPVLEPDPGAQTPPASSSPEAAHPSPTEPPSGPTQGPLSNAGASSAPPSYEPYPTAAPPSFASPSAYGSPTWAATSTGPLSAFGAPLAGWWQRVGSILLDGLVLGVPWLIFTAIVGSVSGTNASIQFGNSKDTLYSSGNSSLVLLLVYIVIQALYFSCFNGQGTGQTVGNRAPGIAVRDAETGEAIGLGRGLVRWLVRIALYCALILPGVLNDLFPLWDKRRQTIADKAARSVVIRLK